MRTLDMSMANSVKAPGTRPMTMFLLVLVLLGVAVGCSGIARHGANSNADDRYVKVEPHAATGNDSIVTRLAHPISLQETEWARLLSDLSVKPRKRWLAFGEKETEPVAAFTEGDRHYLVRHLADTFPLIGPSEWMVFYLAHPQPSGVTEITSGAMFVEHGQLHLLLANYRHAVVISSLQREIREHPLRASGEGFFEFVPRPNQTVVTEPLWDLPKPYHAKFTELMVDIGTPSGSRAPRGNESGMPLEERLRTLDRLYRQGLISQEEYNVKRQQLLDSL